MRESADNTQEREWDQNLEGLSYLNTDILGLENVYVCVCCISCLGTVSNEDDAHQNTEEGG